MESTAIDQRSGKKNLVRDTWIANLRYDMGEDVLELLHRPTVTNVLINADGHIFVKEYGKDKFKSSLVLSPEKRLSIAKNAASVMDQVITDDDPTVAGILPFLKCRFQAILPPWSEATCMAIRKPLGKIVSLEDYVKNGQMSESHFRSITDSIVRRENIVVAGGTDTGKTTIINAMMKVIHEETPNDRMYIVEDTKELSCPVDDRVELEMPITKFIQGLATALRFSPRRIVFGELRHGEACNMLLQAWNTAHNGGFSTIHANSAKSTLKRIYSLLKNAVEGEPDRELICEAVNKIVFMEKNREEKPCVKEVLQVHPELDRDGNFVLTPL